MEAEVGTPIEYNPTEFDNAQKENDDIDDRGRNEEDEYYVPNQNYYQQPLPPLQTQQSNDIFSNLDKTGYIIIFVAFLLGFFMGKTMQPVILRPG